MNNVLRTLVFDGQVSLVLANTTQLINEGIRLHKLAPISAKVFGRALSFMTFMSSCLKEETGEVSLSVKGDGLSEEIAVSGNKKLYMRGYIANTELDDSYSEKDCFGKNGAFTVIRDDGYNRPFVGACAFSESGEIDETFEEYFRISEQLPTRIFTLTEIDETGKSNFSGIVVLQPLPFADANTLEEVEKISLADILNDLKELSLEETVFKNFPSETQVVWSEREAVYKCNCSRNYLAGLLVSLGERQMRDIIREDGAVNVHCHYCNTDYTFTEKDADELFSKK